MVEGGGELKLNELDGIKASMIQKDIDYTGRNVASDKGVLSMGQSVINAEATVNQGNSFIGDRGRIDTDRSTSSREGDVTEKLGETSLSSSHDGALNDNDKLSKASSTSPKQIGRQILQSDGVYIEGKVQGRVINFTVDTGAARTVLSSKAYHQILVQ